LITNRIYKHICDNRILPPEQKGIKQQAHGCKDHLLLDKVILEVTNQNKRNVSFVWIDYQKSYNSVLHSWIKEILETYKIEPTLRHFIEKLIPLWRTRLNLHTEGETITTKELAIRSVIFQGDSLSPLIFCIALFPLSRQLHGAGTGFKLGKKKISHLLYIGNLKVYANDDEEMVRCMELIKRFRDDIGMSFGYNKCAIITIKNGKPVETTILDDFPKLRNANGHHHPRADVD